MTGPYILAGWLARRPIGMIAGAYVLSGAVFWLLVAKGTAQFVDLQVYRMGGQAVIDGTPL